MTSPYGARTVLPPLGLDGRRRSGGNGAGRWGKRGEGMISLMRIATATLLLAALAGMAWAEDGWVLWLESTPAAVGQYRVGDSGWSIESAHASQTACEAAVRDLVARATQLSIPGYEVRAEGNVIIGFYHGNIGTTRFLCLPAGVDPRPPAPR